MAEQHGIIGENSYGIEIPETQVDEVQLDSEKNVAKFSRSKEFKALKAHLETRIAYYQTFLPDGRVVGTERPPDGNDWLIANVIISEFKAVIQAYEDANQAVKEAKNAARS